MFPGGMGKTLQEMQKKLAKLETDLKDRVVESAAGGGMVKVRVNGQEEVVDVKIDPSVINPDDKQLLEDMILAALNEGVKKAKKLREAEIAKITGLNMPGMF